MKGPILLLLDKIQLSLGLGGWLMMNLDRMTTLQMIPPLVRMPVISVSTGVSHVALVPLPVASTRE